MMNLLEPLVRHPSDIYLREFQEQMEDWGIKRPCLKYKDEWSSEWIYIVNNYDINIYNNVFYEDCRISLASSKPSPFGEKFMVYDKRWFLPEDKNKRMLAYCNIVKYLKGDKEL